MDNLVERNPHRVPSSLIENGEIFFVPGSFAIIVCPLVTRITSRVAVDNHPLFRVRFIYNYLEDAPSPPFPSVEKERLIF